MQCIAAIFEGYSHTACNKEVMNIPNILFSISVMKIISRYRIWSQPFIESTLTFPPVSRTNSNTSITNNNHVPYELNAAPSPSPTPLQRHHRERPFSSSQSEIPVGGEAGNVSSSPQPKPRPARHTVDGSQVCWDNQFASKLRY